MGSQECLELLRGVRDCAFATIDRNGLPAVRIIDVMLKEEGVSFFVRHVARISMRSFWRIPPLL